MGSGRQKMAVWWLYRLYTKDGERLYVGIESKPGTRIGVHLTKKWGPLIDETRTERVELNGGVAMRQWQAEQVEKQAIRAHGGTLANTHHNTPDWGRVDVLLAAKAGVDLPPPPPVVVSGSGPWVWRALGFVSRFAPVGLAGLGVAVVVVVVTVGRWRIG